MVPQAHHAEKIRRMQMEARRSGLVEDVIPVIEMEIRDTAKGLFGSGWEPVDIRDYCHAINAQLSPPIPKRMIDEWIAGTLEDRQNEVAPLNDKPCDHICALENEVRSWGEDFAFTFGIGPLDGSWGRHHAWGNRRARRCARQHENKPCNTWNTANAPGAA